MNSRFFGLPVSPVILAGLRPARKREVLAWPLRGHASTLLCSGDPLAGREQKAAHLQRLAGADESANEFSLDASAFLCRERSHSSACPALSDLLQ